MNRLFLVALLIVAGCGGSVHGQVPPTPAPTVVLTATAPTNCTGCSYVTSSVTVASGPAGCPPPATAAPFNYIPLNQATPTATPNYTDSPAVSTVTIFKCYIMQTLQGTAVSAPSNIVGPVTVPPNPLAPSSLH